MTERVPIAIIGGSGLYEIEGVDIVDEIEVETPFGASSAPITIGEFEGRRVAFLPRHGANHEFNPSVVPYRANFWALKSLGVFWVVTVSAVGSLKEEIEPGHFVIPDQVIDKTYRRPNTMFDEIAVHAGLSYPFHPMLRKVLLSSAQAEEGLVVHDGGTYVCMEGPAFSTIAESHLHRAWGASLIGMTAQPEARLARECEMCYATIAMPTDYDVWHEADEVDVTEVLAVIRKNVANVRNVLRRVIPSIPLDQEEKCDASNALQYAIVTKPSAIPRWTRENLDIILGKYL